jgi:hypothetical protein
MVVWSRVGQSLVRVLVANTTDDLAPRVVCVLSARCAACLLVACWFWCPGWKFRSVLVIGVGRRGWGEVRVRGQSLGQQQVTHSRGWCAQRLRFCLRVCHF